MSSDHVKPIGPHRRVFEGNPSYIYLTKNKFSNNLILETNKLEDLRILDPACGSGTLLVAAYKRKQTLYTKLYGYKDLDKIHKQFVEHDITGIDIMPFAAHLSAINLAMQNVEQATDTVRIATQDSLDMAKFIAAPRFKRDGLEILPYARAIQLTLNEAFGKLPGVTAKGTLSAEGRGKKFRIEPVDVVIMNPPFSDREKMPKDMREKLKKNEILGNICGHQINLWGYFLALAYYLLKENGIDQITKSNLKELLSS